MTIVEDPTTVPAPKEPAAVSKLEVLLDKPITDASLPTDTAIKVLPDGSIRVGRFVSIWRRVINSSTIWVQAASGIACTIVLAIPQDVLAAAIPPKYAATGLLAFNVATTLARMRTL